MRILISTLLLLASVAAGQGRQPAEKLELPGPRLRIVDSSKVSAAGDRFEAPARVFLGPNGQTVLTSGQLYSPIRAYGANGRRLWSLDNRRDVGSAWSLGWHGTKVWIADQQYGQIAIIEQGEYRKSLELPELIRPSFSQRRTFPVFENKEVFAYLENGSLLVVPRSTLSIVGTPGYDEKMSYLVQVSEDGVIQKTIVKFPSLEYARRHSPAAKSSRNEMDPSMHPLHWPQLRVSPDGKRVLLVTTDTMAPKTDTVIVTVHDGNGAVVFTRKFGFPARRYSEAEADSVAQARFQGSMTVAQREAATKNMSRRVPAILGALVSRDSTVWLTLRHRGASRPVIGIDATGQLIGSLMFPNTINIAAGDRGHLWGALAKDRNQSVVRYTIGKL